MFHQLAGAFAGSPVPSARKEGPDGCNPRLPGPSSQPSFVPFCVSLIRRYSATISTLACSGLTSPRSFTERTSSRYTPGSGGA